MFRRRTPLVITVAVALAAVAGASGEPIVGYTATGSPTAVKPSTQASYTITLKNNSPDKSADRAAIGIATGFVVGSTVKATANCGATTWTVEEPVPSADGKINVKRPGGSANNLCPGGTLTVVFSADTENLVIDLGVPRSDAELKPSARDSIDHRVVFRTVQRVAQR